MRRSFYYHSEADHARRLADITVQQNLEKVLRRIAEKLDHLSDDIATSEVDCRHPEMQQIRISSAGWTQHFRAFPPLPSQLAEGFLRRVLATDRSFASP